MFLDYFLHNHRVQNYKYNLNQLEILLWIISNQVRSSKKIGSCNTVKCHTNSRSRIFRHINIITRHTLRVFLQLENLYFVACEYFLRLRQNLHCALLLMKDESHRHFFLKLTNIPKHRIFMKCRLTVKKNNVSVFRMSSYFISDIYRVFVLVIFKFSS